MFKETFSLNHPIRLAIIPETSQLVINDSGNHRLLIVSHNGQVQDYIGSKAGFIDGSFEKACFNNPLGIVYFNHCLYVADTDNHAIRKIDLKTRQVSTLLSNQNADLESPIDLAISTHHLYISSKKKSQILKYDFQNGSLTPFCGPQKEPLIGYTQIELLQPSAIAFTKQFCLIADASHNMLKAINCMDFHPIPLTGEKDLNGASSSNPIAHLAKLNSPEALVWSDHLKKVIVADTGNHCLKLLDLHFDHISLWLGSKSAGKKNGFGINAQFNHPSGLALTPDESYLFVADKNNHCIRKVEIYTQEVTTFTLYS